MNPDIVRLQQLSGILVEFAPESVARNNLPQKVIWARLAFGWDASFSFGCETNQSSIQNILLNIEENSDIMTEFAGDVDMLEHEASNRVDEEKYGGDESVAREHAILQHGIQLLRALRAKANGTDIVKEVILADRGRPGFSRSTDLEYFVFLYDPNNQVPATPTRSLHWDGDEDSHLWKQAK